MKLLLLKDESSCGCHPALVINRSNLPLDIIEEDVEYIIESIVDINANNLIHCGLLNSDTLEFGGIIITPLYMVNLEEEILDTIELSQQEDIGTSIVSMIFSFKEYKEAGPLRLYSNVEMTALNAVYNCTVLSLLLLSESRESRHETTMPQDFGFPYIHME